MRLRNLHSKKIGIPRLSHNLSHLRRTKMSTLTKQREMLKKLKHCSNLHMWANLKQQFNKKVQHLSKSQNNIKKKSSLQCCHNRKYLKRVLSQITAKILLMWVQVIKSTHLKVLKPLSSRETLKIINLSLPWKKTLRVLDFNLHQLQTHQLIFLDQNKYNH